MAESTDIKNENTVEETTNGEVKQEADEEVVIKQKTNGESVDEKPDVTEKSNEEPSAELLNKICKQVEVRDFFFFN